MLRQKNPDMFVLGSSSEASINTDLSAAGAHVASIKPVLLSVLAHNDLQIADAAVKAKTSDWTIATQLRLDYVQNNLNKEPALKEMRAAGKALIEKYLYPKG